MSHMPGYVWALAVSAAIGIPGLAALMLGRGARQAGESRRTAGVAARGAMVRAGLRRRAGRRLAST